MPPESRHGDGWETLHSPPAMILESLETALPETEPDQHSPVMQGVETAISPEAHPVDDRAEFQSD